MPSYRRVLKKCAVQTAPLATLAITLAAAAARAQTVPLPEEPPFQPPPQLAIVGLPDAPVPAHDSSLEALPDAPPPSSTATGTTDDNAVPCPHQDPNLVPELCGPKPAPKSEKLERFANSNTKLELTPAQKFHLAERNVKDPFNLASIAFFSALDVATDSHGVYGPGLKGFAKDAGTTLTEDINGQFWSTFAVASIAHQDPHYHRMPQATIQRRILHCFDAVVLAQSDSGKTIPNYDNIVGSSIAASINNLYVPYPSTNVPSTVDRVLVGFAFDPIGNAVTEFLPDVARRVNVRVVFVQRVINRLYESQTGGAQLQ